eukprot:CAMPEP_0174855250 /NCGR_PEP_ID=MMETSP1114-20130205/32838_1 /TAXON_ID=312471 /ORGANISM="Neobodo designis, Strain CCAP 1951/1" /LENGTH=72 /DNA_ID=CAMNT_0016089985 /DNA_START=44 /DNA_END=259 /DNA_ORIENTATION=+
MKKCNGSSQALLRRQEGVSAGASSAGRRQRPFHQAREERPDTLAEQDSPTPVAPEAQRNTPSLLSTSSRAPS